MLKLMGAMLADIFEAICLLAFLGAVLAWSLAF
jgi:hypothetical protein